MQSLGKLRLTALACSALFLLCELISHPWAEMGISDDWSYIRSAQLLAQTGHIHYVGWSTPILGWQLYFGAALIKLFGFSFTAPRMGTLLIALITTYFIQRTLVRFGITETNAILGTLLFILSPLFMLLSATMMSDIPGFFSILLCLYGCARALQANSDRDTVLWLCFAVAVNAICGTARQIAWLGVLTFVPSTLWLLRSRRIVLLYGLAATALGFLFVFATLHWFNMQPYVQQEPFNLPPLRIWALKLIGLQCGRAIIEFGLLLFPLSLPFIAATRRFYPRTFAVMGTLAASCIALIYYRYGTGSLSFHASPFNGDWVGPHSVFESTGLVSTPPMVLSPALYTSLSVLSIFGILCVGITILLARPAAIKPQQADAFSWQQLAVLFGPFTLVYSILLIHRAIYVVFDRYLFAPMLLAIICIFLYIQQRLKTGWLAPTSTAVAIIAFYGVISTHNNFALARARVALNNEIFAANVPPSHVDLGWEVNGWYELQRSNSVNDTRVIRPAGAYHRYNETPRYGCHEQTPYGFFPHLAPQYGLSFDPNLCDGRAPFAPVSYSTWPLRHPTMLYVVKYPKPWQSAIDAENHTPPATDK